MSQLFIVGTPIGNLGDITVRALETLRNVDIIACEDTRHSLKLLSHFGIQKRLVSCRARNEQVASENIIKLLDEGNDIAYISDAGTPALSDPGAILVHKVRETVHTIIPIPGASAFATLLSVAGSFDKAVTFGGFLPQKGLKRKKKLQEFLDTGYGLILYESPYRILKLLEEVAEIDNTRQVIVGRELTKMHEEVVCKTAGEMLADFKARPSIKGEFCIFVTGIT